MPVSGLPKALETLLTMCVEEFDLHKWQISNTKNGCMLKINFNSGSHCGTEEPQIKPVSYKKKTPAQEKRDSERIQAYKSQRSGYHTRSKDKLPETARKDSTMDDKLLEISPVSVESAASIDVHCSPILSDSHSDETARSVKEHNSFSPPNQDISNFNFDYSEDRPLTFGANSSTCNSDSIETLPSYCESIVADDNRDNIDIRSDYDLDMQALADDNVKCPAEKPYSFCMNTNCDLAKQCPDSKHPPSLDHGYYKCDDCGIQLCCFCLYDNSGHNRNQKKMIYHHGTLS